MSGELLSRLSRLDQAVLFAVMRLNPNACGMSIRDEIERQTGDAVPLGTIYSRIERLEESKYISSTLGEKVVKRGGRRKRFYTINGLGRAALDRSASDFRNLSKGVLGGEVAL